MNIGARIPLANARGSRRTAGGLRRLPLGAILALLGALAIAAMLAYALYGISPESTWSFVVRVRGTTIATMGLVSAAAAFSTVVFHSITGNRLLTPSIMGFDALFVLIQTVMLFFLGGTVSTRTGSLGKLLLDSTVMVLFAAMLYGWLFRGRRASLQVLLLVGVVFGVFFTSVSTFLQRALEPRDFDLLFAATTAKFTLTPPELLPAAAIIVASACALIWLRIPRLDVTALGPDVSTGLGLNHRFELQYMLVLVAILAAVSTALVGPMTFFGFMIATLAYQITGSHRHALNIPTAFLLGLVVLIGGQFLLDQVLDIGLLATFVELVGGILFLAFLFRKGFAR